MKNIIEMMKNVIKKYGLLSGTLGTIIGVLLGGFLFSNRDTGIQIQNNGPNSPVVRITGANATYAPIFYYNQVITNSGNSAENSMLKHGAVESIHEDKTAGNIYHRSIMSNSSTHDSKGCTEECYNIFAFDQNRKIGINIFASNYSNNENEYRKIIYAKRGDLLYFKIMVANNTNKETRKLAAYIQIPPGLSYVKGYSKLYYTDENNKDHAAPLGDHIASAKGVMIGSIPPKHYEYIVYKIKVAPNAPSGTYSTGNMVADGSRINVSSNDAKVVVSN